MEILDTHFHLWDIAARSYSWVEEAIDSGVHFVERGLLPQTFSIADYDKLWRTFSVRPFVHVEAGADADSGLEETRSLADLAKAGARDLRLVVPARLESAGSYDAIGTHLTVTRSIVGVRQIVTWSKNPSISFVPEDLLAARQWRRGLDAVADLELSFDLQIYPEQSKRAAEIIGDRPGIRFIVNHSLLPALESREGMATWRAGLRQLASYPNVALKLGGLAMRNPHWTTAQAIGAFSECVQVFGVERVMIGTNTPVETASRAADEVAEVIGQLLATLSPGERAWVARESALMWYHH